MTDATIPLDRTKPELYDLDLTGGLLLLGLQIFIPFVSELAL